VCELATSKETRVDDIRITWVSSLHQNIIIPLFRKKSFAHKKNKYVWLTVNYIVPPGYFLNPRVGFNTTFKVNVLPFPNMGWVYFASKVQVNLGNDCEKKSTTKIIALIHQMVYGESWALAFSFQKCSGTNTHRKCFQCKFIT